MEQLKPCPFCGADVKMIMQENSGVIICPRCKVYKLFTILIDGKEKAIEVWNRRVEDGTD